MAEIEEALKPFIEKMLDLECRQPENELTEARLKQIALDVGLTELEYQAALDKADTYLDQGRAYLESYNWHDAATALEHAVALQPLSVEANALLAKAWMNRAEADVQPNLFDTSQRYLERCLTLQPDYRPGLELKGALRKKRRRHRDRTASAGRRSMQLVTGVAAAAVIGVAIVFFSVYNGLIDHEEQVNAAWSQVENVYQRRADLVPQLVAMVNAAADIERTALDDLLAAHAAVADESIAPESLDDAALTAFQEKQERLSAGLADVLTRYGARSQEVVTENFLALQAQLEGSENRITVERKRYNDAVRRYNGACRRFPGNLLGFKSSPYLQARDALAPPAIKID